MSGGRAHRAWRDEQGDVTTQYVVLVPLLVTLVLAVVQAALWFHTAHLAQAGAARGAAAAAPITVDRSVAASVADEVIRLNGGRLASPISVDAGPDGVRVVVELEVPRVVPFFPATVRRSQWEPRERFVPEDER